MLNPHLVATLCSSFSRENGHLLLICSSLSTAHFAHFSRNSSTPTIHFQELLLLVFRVRVSVIFYGTHRDPYHGMVAWYIFCRQKKIPRKSAIHGWGKYIIPETNDKSPWKMMVGRLLSYWEGLFSGAMLVSGRVSNIDPMDNTHRNYGDHLRKNHPYTTTNLNPLCGLTLHFAWVTSLRLFSSLRTSRAKNIQHFKYPLVNDHIAGWNITNF